MTVFSAPEASDGPAPSGRPTPDYDLVDSLTITEPSQYRALFEDTRAQIVGILLERAATTSELAGLLGKPKGTVGHHLKVLEEAGLVHVVRTKAVRALEAKYYGRTARVFYFQRVEDAVGAAPRLLQRASEEVAAALASPTWAPDDPRALDVNRRDVRIASDRAREFAHRLADLMLEFADEPRSGDTTYALVYAVFPTGRPALTESSS